jgi:glutaminyl-peptide cyclotransferase
MRVPPLRAVGMLGVLVLLTACPRDRTGFDGARAYEYVRTQLEFGPRVPGTEGHQRMGDWLVAHLSQVADTVIEQRWTHVTITGDSLPMRNVIARFNPAAAQRILYLAHWDTRPIAEKDPDPARRDQPIPGANDGASGVAILLGVADELAARRPSFGVDLLFVDGEDYGSFEDDTDVLIGSRYFAANPVDEGYQPMFGVLYDMVGAEGARFLQEGYSVRHAPEVVRRVWGVAAELGLSNYFVPREGGFITDDHLPLLEVGMRVINVIQDPRDYPEHHTHADDLSRISRQTLKAVGDVAVSLLRR